MLQKLWISDDMQNGTMAKSYFHIIFAEIQYELLQLQIQLLSYKYWNKKNFAPYLHEDLLVTSKLAIKIVSKQS